LSGRVIAPIHGPRAVSLPEIAAQRAQGRRRIPVRGNSLMYIGAAIVGLILVLAAFAPVIALHPPAKLDFRHKLVAPTSDFPFGTDEFGRDLFSRTLYGARISLQAAAIILIVGGTIGTVLGLITAYKGGWYDDIAMRISDIFMAFPSLLLAMTVSAALGASLQAATLAIAFVWWPSYARIVRSTVLTIRAQPYIEAARVAGSHDSRIIIRHVFPNALSPLIVKATTDIGAAILLTASLGFLGLGAQEPTAEWGRMVAAGRTHILDAWWYPTFPGLAIFVSVLGFAWIGDGLRDFLDPVLRKRG